MKSREARHEVLVRARMRAGGPPADVCIRNLSSRGMLCIAAQPPSRGTYVEIVAPVTTLTGRVIWSNERRFGIVLREKIRPHEFVRGLTGDPAESVADSTSPRQTGAGEPLYGSAFRWSAGAAAGLLAALGCAAIVYDTLAATFGQINHHLIPPAQERPKD
ncbi:MAG: PilZ domain-containing protein [Sphingomonadaceae bacterium]